MLQSKIGRNFFICFVLLNLLLVGSFAFAVLKRPDLLSKVLSGTFGPTASPDLTGNMLFLAFLLTANAAVFLLFGVGGTWHALWGGLRVSPKRLRRFLHESSGLASDISGIVAEAVQEEEKRELAYLGTARSLLAIGLVLFVVSLPALCISYSKAASNAASLFENVGAGVANGTVAQDTVLRFTADQLAGGLLLDVPEIFHLRATPVETNGANLPFAIFVLLYRAIVGFGVLIWFVAGRRMSALRDAAMEVAMPAADIVAMEPILQDGHGRHEPAHHDPVPPDHGHHDHGNDDNHGHSDPVHDVQDHHHNDHAQEDGHNHQAPEHNAHAHENHAHEAPAQHEDHHVAESDDETASDTVDEEHADPHTPADDHQASDEGHEHHAVHPETGGGSDHGHTHHQHRADAEPVS
jgi:hypothetical protein